MATRHLVASAVAILLLAGLVVLPSEAVRAEPRLELYMSGLDWPVAIAFASDGRVFYAELLSGNIRIIEDGILMATPFLTLPNTLVSEGGGLLGLAIDPDFPTEPYVYAYQTFDDVANGTQYNRVVRLQAVGNTGVFDRVLLDGIAADISHNGGVIEFGPDGRLYVLTGDKTDPRLSQDLSSPHGKVLRVNRDGTVPDDNPFVGNSTVYPFVYTYGHRNTFGVAFHPVTGSVFLSENGPACNDEVNLLIPGRNYGWGPSQTCSSPPPPPNNTNQDGPSPVLPIAWYTPVIAPTNLIVYSGSMFPEFEGDLILGSYNGASLRHLDLAPPNYDAVVSDSVMATTPEGILDVAQGADGAIWLTMPSAIYRYVYIPRPPVPSITTSATVVNPMEAITLDASGSYDPDGAIVSYDWDFGDGETAAGPVATHSYPRPGIYRIALALTDERGYQSGTSVTVTVNEPPRALFTTGSTDAYVGVAIVFDASNSTDVDGTIAAYRWDFGDFSRAEGVTTSHTYASRGAFIVTLTVVDNYGLSRQTAHTVFVGNRAPVIASSGPQNSEILIASTSSQLFRVDTFDPDGDPVTLVWRLNGTSAAENTRTYTFNPLAPGVYRVSIVASDGELYVSREWTVVVEGVPMRPPSFSLELIFLLGAILGASLVMIWQLRGARSRRPKPPSN